MLTKPLNTTHAPVGISEYLGVEMSDPRTNSSEHPDGPAILDIGKRIRPLLRARDPGAEMFDP
jgi:hypothetical protein